MAEQKNKTQTTSKSQNKAFEEAEQRYNQAEHEFRVQQLKEEIGEIRDKQQNLLMQKEMIDKELEELSKREEKLKQGE